MHTVLLVISILVLIYFLYNGIELIYSKKIMPSLKNVNLDGVITQPPKISIIIPARNEAQTIREAVITIANLEYPNKEIIIVNDRSEDNTKAVLEELVKKFNFIQIINIEALPENWLGKNNALHTAAKQASGEWLLFTDADIHHQPKTLLKAVQYAINKKLDHLTLQPKISYVSPLFGILMTSLVTAFSLQNKPWRAQFSRSKRSIGIGAFNLVKRQVYMQIGGHEKISMNTDDDLKLGQLIKHSGYRQGIASALDFISVDWYDSAGSMIRGLEKNTFSTCNYNVSMVVLFASMLCIFYLFPIAMLFAPNNFIAISVFTIAFTAVLHGIMAKRMEYPFWLGLAYPIGVLISLYILYRSAFKAITTQSVSWRGTSYPLSAIKRKHLNSKF